MDNDAHEKHKIKVLGDFSICFTCVECCNPHSPSLTSSHLGRLCALLHYYYKFTLQVTTSQRIYDTVRNACPLLCLVFPFDVLSDVLLFYISFVFLFILTVCYICCTSFYSDSVLCFCVPFYSDSVLYLLCSSLF
jgi:hypothetical protein